MLPMDSAAVLTAVARHAAEATTLTELVPRLAPVVREAIPFEQLHVLRLDRAKSVVLYVVRADGELEMPGHRIANVRPVGESAMPTRVSSARWVAGRASKARSGSPRASPTPFLARTRC